MKVISVFTSIAALAVGIVAVAKEEYIIAAAMLLVAVWQIFIVRTWNQKK